MFAFVTRFFFLVFFIEILYCVLSKVVVLWNANAVHTIYTRNNMGQKCEGNCGLWVLNDVLQETYPENLKKNVGAVWELPTK